MANFYCEYCGTKASWCCHPAIVTGNGSPASMAPRRKLLPARRYLTDYDGTDIPEYNKHCTYRLFKDNLASLCKGVRGVVFDVFTEK